MRATARVVLSFLLIIGALAIWFMNYRHDRAVRSTEVADCILGYIGDSPENGYIRDYDWAWLATLPTAAIIEKTSIPSPHRANLINNCLKRPIE